MTDGRTPSYSRVLIVTTDNVLVKRQSFVSDASVDQSQQLISDGEASLLLESSSSQPDTRRRVRAKHLG